MAPSLQTTLDLPTADAEAKEQRRIEAVRRAAERRRTDTIARAISEVETSGCGCGLHAGMTDADLRALDAGCTAPRWVCPALDSVRRSVGA